MKYSLHGSLHLQRIFECETLKYVGTLPKLSPVGSFTGSTHMEETEEVNDKTVFADVLATQYDPTTGHLTCIYSDRSFVIWDISDPNNAILYRSQMFHSDCVWGVEVRLNVYLNDPTTIMWLELMKRGS